MKPIEKEIEIKDNLVAKFHVISDNFVINFPTKVIQGAVNSYLDGNVANNFKNGKVEPIAIYPFHLDYNCLTTIEEEIENFVNININNIIK